MSKHKKMLTRAILNGKLVKITEVENGLACGCICLHCKTKLIAKNNPRNDVELHFSHHNGKECEGAYESVLHLLVKEVLAKTKTIRTPNYIENYDRKQQKVIYKGEIIAFDEIVIEKQVSYKGITIKPDAIGIIQGKQVFIEFAKTHFVDVFKKDKIIKIGTACIELDIGHLELDEKKIKDFFTSETPLSYWITNPKLDAKYKTDLLKAEKEKERLFAEELAEEKRKEEQFEQMFKEYQAKDEYTLRIEEDDEIRSCPLKKKAKDEFKSSHFYKYPLLKRIADGAKWNRQLYGRSDSYIFLNGEQIFVYPLEKNHMITDNQEKESNLIYAGLMRIKNELSHATSFTCENCEFHVNYIQMGYSKYRVCKHP